MADPFDVINEKVYGNRKLAIALAAVFATGDSGELNTYALENLNKHNPNRAELAQFVNNVSNVLQSPAVKADEELVEALTEINTVIIPNFRATVGEENYNFYVKTGQRENAVTSALDALNAADYEVKNGNATKGAFSAATKSLTELQKNPTDARTIAAAENAMTALGEAGGKNADAVLAKVTDALSTGFPGSGFAAATASTTRIAINPADIPEAGTPNYDNTVSMGTGAEVLGRYEANLPDTAAGNSVKAALNASFAETGLNLTDNMTPQNVARLEVQAGKVLDTMYLDADGNALVADGIKRTAAIQAAVTDDLAYAREVMGETFQAAGKSYLTDMQNAVKGVEGLAEHMPQTATSLSDAGRKTAGVVQAAHKSGGASKDAVVAALATASETVRNTPSMTNTHADMIMRGVGEAGDSTSLAGRASSAAGKAGRVLPLIGGAVLISTAAASASEAVEAGEMTPQQAAEYQAIAFDGAVLGEIDPTIVGSEFLNSANLTEFGNKEGLSEAARERIGADTVAEQLTASADAVIAEGEITGTTPILNATRAAHEAWKETSFMDGDLDPNNPKTYLEQMIDREAVARATYDSLLTSAVNDPATLTVLAENPDFRAAVTATIPDTGPLAEVRQAAEKRDANQFEAGWGASINEWGRSALGFATPELDAARAAATASEQAADATFNKAFPDGEALASYMENGTTTPNNPIAAEPTVATAPSPTAPIPPASLSTLSPELCAQACAAGKSALGGLPYEQEHVQNGTLVAAQQVGLVQDSSASRAM